ncbi:MAG: sigma-70 family RNA polymerase sigma factor [Bryobacterales bacterium]|nr:sigma-70 family RNA polymerase sigma factor [Bryobacterales bacterium]
MLRFRSAVSASPEDLADRGQDSTNWVPMTPSAGAGSDDARVQGEFALPQPEVVRDLVERVENGDPTAKYGLYEIFNRGIRFQLVRHLGTADLDDKVHDTFLIVLQAIVRKDLRDPDRLLAYIRTIVKRQIASYIDRAVTKRREHPESAGLEFHDPCFNPEQALINHERKRVMRAALSELNARDREILIRFYLDEMPMEEICEEMGLTANQFRLLKSRAKTRFSEAGRRQLRPKVLARYQTVAAQ